MHNPIRRLATVRAKRPGSRRLPLWSLEDRLAPATFIDPGYPLGVTTTVDELDGDLTDASDLSLREAVFMRMDGPERAYHLVSGHSSCCAESVN